MRVYLVATEGSLLWNGELTPWHRVEADSPEEAASRHVSNLHDHFRQPRFVEGVNVLEPEVYCPADDSWPCATTSTGPYVVKLPGQADSEAVAVLVDIWHFVAGRQIPRHVPD